MHSCWKSLTSGAYQTSRKSIKLQHRGHTLRTSRMCFKDSLNPKSTNLQSGFGFAGQRRPRFKSQLLRTRQCSQMCTIFNMRTIGPQVMRDWKIVQPIIGWHKAWCTSSFSFRSRTKHQGQIRLLSQTRLQLCRHQCIPSLVSIMNLSTGLTIQSCEWNSTFEFSKCSTSLGTAYYLSLAAGKFHTQGW